MKRTEGTITVRNKGTSGDLELRNGVRASWMTMQRNIPGLRELAELIGNEKNIEISVKPKPRNREIKITVRY